MAVALSFAAGFVDLVGALKIFDLFTAHVSGTTVRLAQRLVEHRWGEATAAVTIVCVFFGASLLGRVLIESAQRSGFRRVASITFGIEWLLLVCVLVIGTTRLSDASPPHAPTAITYLLLAMLAAAMGLQTASLTRIGPLTVHTTFVTGMINKLAQVTSLWIFAAYDLRFGRNHSRDPALVELASTNARKVRFLVSLWILYVAGAASGTLLTAREQFAALYWPCGILLAVIIVDQRRPLSIEEEQEQAE